MRDPSTYHSPPPPPPPVRRLSQVVGRGGGLLSLLFLTTLASPTARYRCQEEQLEGTFVADTASDPVHPGGSLTYSIFRIFPNVTDMFQLDPKSGRLAVGRRLDREAICPQKSTCVVVLDIAVKDNDILSHTVKVEITVDDVNDNEPRFGDVILRKSVLESIPRGLILELSPAVDPDSPDNGVSGYHLEQESGPFRLVVDQNRVTNTVGLRLYLTDQLDRELESHHYLKVMAVDKGQPSRTGTMLIEIEVADVNDNSPHFQNSTYEATLSSDADVGTMVIQVLALDPDNGANGQVRYYLSKRSRGLYGNLFEVNEQTGEVLTKKRLNETGSRTMTSYKLDIVAEDLGQNSIPTQTSVQIQLESINRHPPVIHINTLHPTHSSSLSTILENNLQSAFISHVAVDDDDIGASGKVTCSVDRDEFALVPMGEKRFKVVASRSFDREDNDLYTLTLKCSDLGTPPLTSQEKLVVRIDDVDDNEPRFDQQEYNCSVVENAPKGTSLVRIRALDPDEGPNAEVIYSLGPDADPGLFAIDPRSGELTSIEPLDREKIDRYDFHVIARSSKVKDSSEVTCLVHVTVLDADDEFPRFENSSYKFEISENENSGTEVGRVRAVDLDLPPNDRIVYRLEFAPDDHVTATCFVIDPVLGIIFTRQSLDREAASHHTMRVRTSGHDVTGPSDVTVVFVKVNDVNDNAPVVTFPAADDNVVHVTGNTSRIVANLSAYDRDAGVNSELTFAIVAGNDRRSYSLDSRTGSLALSTQNASSSSTSGLHRRNSDDCIDVLDISVRDRGLPVALTTVTRLFVVFDCEPEVGDENRKSFDDDDDVISFNSNGPSFFFVAITIALVSLILVLVLVAAKAEGRRRNIRVVKVKDDGDRGATGSEVRGRGDVLDSVDRGSDDTLDGILIGSGNGRIPSSSLELDRCGQENETNEQRKIPMQADDLDDSTSGNERDNDSGCVDVSSV